MWHLHGFRQKGLGFSLKCSSRKHSVAVAADATRCFGCLVADGKQGVVEEIGVLDYIGASVGVPSLWQPPNSSSARPKTTQRRMRAYKVGGKTVCKSSATQTPVKGYKKWNLPSTPKGSHNVLMVVSFWGGRGVGVVFGIWVPDRCLVSKCG